MGGPPPEVQAWSRWYLPWGIPQPFFLIGWALQGDRHALGDSPADQSHPSAWRPSLGKAGRCPLTFLSPRWLFLPKSLGRE